MDSDTVTRAPDFSCIVSGEFTRPKSTDPDFIDMCALTADNDTCVLGDNQASHRDLLGRRFGSCDRGGGDG